MDLAKKHNIKWENRYDVLTVEVRHRIIDELIEPLKKRGAELERLINEHPRLIDENGKPTERLVILGNKYIDGHIIEKGFDQKGNYAIFQAKNRAENEQWQYILNKRKKLSILAQLQRSLNEVNIDYSIIQAKKKEIDTLFVDVFEIENNNKTTNPYPYLFKENNTYINFIDYTRRHIVDYYSDYSYLYQRLLNDKLIFYIKHLDFMKWLYDEKFISEKFYDDFLKKGNFKSFKKSSSAQRENNFNNTFL